MAASLPNIALLFLHWRNPAMSLPSLSVGSKTGPARIPLLNLAVFSAGFVTFLNMWCTQSILPVRAPPSHIAEARTNLTVTAPLVATAMMAPLIGAISDRFGRKKFIYGAGLMLVLPTLMAAAAQSYELFVLCRFIQGLTLPFIFAITVAYIGEETSGPATARLAGPSMSGTIFGGFSGRLITGFVTSEYGWRPAFIVLASLTLLISLVVATLLPREQKFRPLYGVGRAMASFPLHLSNPRLLATFAIGFGVLFSLVAVFTYINFRLAAAPYALGPAALSGIFIVYLGGVVMSPIAARLSNRFGRQRVMACAAPLILAGLALTLARPLPLIVLGLLLISSAIFLEQTLATAFVSTVAQKAKSTAVGLYVTFYYVGGSFGGFVPARIWS